METLLSVPNMIHNPLHIEGMNFSDVQQIQLKVLKRYVDLNYTDKVASFYVELVDSKNNVLLLPVKYFIWVACAHTKVVICDYVKVTGAGKSYNLVEISDMKKVNLNITEQVSEPLIDSNMDIADHYCEKFTEECLVKRALNNVRHGMVYGMCTGYINNNTTYVRGMCRLADLIDRTSLYRLSYRKLVIKGETFITDIEAKKEVI